MTARKRIEVMHGVNFDQLGRRDKSLYGDLDLDRLVQQVGECATELGLEARFYQSNHEGDYVEHLHRLEGMADGVILNPGAWTHYAWAIHDALELTGLPAAEVHLSDINAREDWRRLSVISDLCLITVAGQGLDGYRIALERLRDELNK